MSDYLYDVSQGQVVYLERTFTDSTGAPTAVSSGSACVKRMSDQVLGPGCTAITTSGGLATLSVTTASSASFYVKGDYSVYMGAGTVSGVSVIGYTLGQFSVGKLTAFTFSTNVLQWNGTTPNNLISGRVDANAAAVTVSANVLQWNSANVSSAASGIPKVDIDTIKTNPVVNGGTITFPTTATLASTTNITAGTITTVTNLTNAPTAGDFTSTMKTSIQTAVTAVTVSADVLKISGSNVNTSSAQLGVNVVNIGGVAAALATLSATMVGVSTTGSTSIQNAVWDTVLASHVTAGSTGAALNAAGGAGDPWITAIPGSYTAGQAGYLVGNLMNHTTFTVSADVITVNGLAPSTTSDVVTAMTATTLSADVKKWLGTTPNALISGRVDANAAAVTVSSNILTWVGSTPNALIAGRVDANVNATITAATVSANVLAINAVSTSPVTTVKAVQGLTTADQVTTVSGNVNGSVGSVTGAVGSVTGAVGSVTGNVGGNVVGSVASVTGAVGSVTGNVGGNVVGSVASVTAGVTLTAAERNSTADAFLNRDIATGASATTRNVQNALRAIRNKTEIAGTTLTVYQEDDSTPAWTAVTTTTSAVSIASIDPA